MIKDQGFKIFRDCDLGNNQWV